MVIGNVRFLEMKIVSEFMPQGRDWLMNRKELRLAIGRKVSKRRHAWTASLADLLEGTPHRKPQLVGAKRRKHAFDMAEAAITLRSNVR